MKNVYIFFYIRRKKLYSKYFSIFKYDEEIFFLFLFFSTSSRVSFLSLQFLSGFTANEQDEENF
jgi:hypothetical protein